MMRLPFCRTLLFIELLTITTACVAAPPQTPAVAGNESADPQTPGTDDLNARLEALKAKTLKDLVFVEGGTFTMGDFGPLHSPERLPYTGERDDDVLREVTLDSFSIGAYQVAYADFDVFTDSTGRARLSADADDRELRTVPDFFRKLPNYPIGVNWHDARAYCQWIGEQLNLPMDLPTEAQWEYAARSRGQMRVFPTDTGWIDNGKNVASFSQRETYAYEQGVIYTPLLPVGLYPPNPIGLYDMTGNGYEWTLDWYAPNYSADDIHNPKGPSQGTEKVQRSYELVGGDTLVHTAMSFARYKKIPDTPPPLVFADGEVIKSNRNRIDTVRCVVNSPLPSRQ